MNHQFVLSPMLEILDQGLILVAALDDANYVTKIPKLSNASIGAHYRHCLDHFDCLLGGISHGFIDYDDRKRNPLLETDRIAAAEMTRSLKTRAQQKLEYSIITDPIPIRCKISYKNNEIATLDSRIDREIMFCISHSIHHYAIIGMMCGLLEIPLPEGFGIAPSTIKHQQETARLAA